MVCVAVVDSVEERERGLHVVEAASRLSTPFTFAGVSGMPASLSCSTTFFHCSVTPAKSRESRRVVSYCCCSAEAEAEGEGEGTAVE